MQKIKTFLEAFFSKETTMLLLKSKPDIEAYNTALSEYLSFLVRQLHGTTGHLIKTEPDDEDIMEMLNDFEDPNERRLFKISEYEHEKYGKVFVAFTSSDNPTETLSVLSDAIIIIEEEKELKIAKFLLYTNYTERGNKDASYRWDKMGGYTDLNFDTLNGPIKIERFQQPSDWREGLKLYNDDI
jgi:hypothetical protein